MKRNYFADKMSQTKVKAHGLSLTTYYCGDSLAYKMYVDGKLLFKGTDFKPSPFYDWDALETNLSLLGFLCIGIEDTDDEYFKDYNPEQMKWAKGFEKRANLNMWISDIENDEEYKEEALTFFTHKTF